MPTKPMNQQERGEAVTLTDEDRAAAAAATSRLHPMQNFWTAGVEAIYLAGLHAGMERAAEICEKMRDAEPNLRAGFSGGFRQAASGCAAAIREAARPATDSAPDCSLPPT